MPRTLLALLLLLSAGAVGRTNEFGDSADYYAEPHGSDASIVTSPRPGSERTGSAQAEVVWAEPVRPGEPAGRGGVAAAKAGETAGATAAEGGRCCHGVCRHPGHPAKPRHDKPGDIDRGDHPSRRYRTDGCQRAGMPHRVAPWATCGVDEKYTGWFVGGGSAFCTGRPRHRHEGTWGLDYNGLFGKAKVWLNYTRGRHQGGTGAYRTDGEPEAISRAKNLLHHGH